MQYHEVPATINARYIVATSLGTGHKMLATVQNKFQVSYIALT